MSASPSPSPPLIAAVHSPLCCAFASRALVVNRNLPFKISAEEMYDIFGKYGAIRQIRLYVRSHSRSRSRSRSEEQAQRQKRRERRWQEEPQRQ